MESDLGRILFQRTLMALDRVRGTQREGDLERDGGHSGERNRHLEEPLVACVCSVFGFRCIDVSGPGPRGQSHVLRWYQDAMLTMIFHLTGTYKTPDNILVIIQRYVLRY